MAWPKPSMSIVSDPTVGLGPGDDPSSPPSVDSAFPIAPEPSARRLVGRCAEHFLTFDTADGRLEAFSNVSLQVADGQFVSFIGPSGCGRTTILRVITDLQQPSSGTLLINGVSAENPRLSRSHGIALAALAGVAFYGLVTLAERATTFWHPSYRT
jgi:NitT/TauT family transport system ATP-binding protein